MSTTVDQRVVEMRFDNKHFEKNVSTTMSTLEKLKHSLKLDGASKGLDKVSTSAKKVDLSGLGSAADTVGLKFNAMYTMADQAFRNIVNSAMSAGKRIVSALTIDPVRTGLSEYETQINAVQTILANTESKGTTLDDVNGALDTLNKYADKTIYNFTEMTRNIGTFTAAGVDLDTSVSAIQGIANLAAVSGSSSAQASTAMYQLSQALANGVVRLTDWNSVSTAGMGGEVFQNALKETARVHGVAIDEIIEKNGSFRSSLHEDWLTSEILTETLSHFTMAAEEGSEQWNEYKKSLMASGYTEEQAKAILKMSNTATDAATKVKTASQLFDTLKETAQSGWTETWETIFGDFEGAKNLFSGLYEKFSKILEASAKTRNDLLKGWAKAGGRNDLIDSLYNVIDAIRSVIKPIKEGFRDIFPKMTVDRLVEFTKRLKELTEKMKLGENVSSRLRSTFKGMFAVLDIVRQAVRGLFTALKPLFKKLGELGVGLLGVTGKLGDWLEKLSDSIRESNFFGRVFGKIVNTILNFASAIQKVFATLIKWLSPVFEAVKKLATSIGEAFSSIANKAEERLSPLAAIGSFIKGVFDAIGKAITKAAPWISKFIQGIINSVRGLFDKIATAVQNADYNQLFDFVNGGIISAIGVFIARFMKSAGDLMKNASGFVDNFKEILGGVRDALDGFTKTLKAEALKRIATAIAILAASLFVISLIDSGKLTLALTAVAALFGELMAAMAIFSKMFEKKQLKNLNKVAKVMRKLAVGILILSVALKIMSGMTWEEMAVGLVSMAGAMAIMIAAIRLLPEKNVNKAAKAIKKLSKALITMGVALLIMSTMSWGELARGLVAMAGGLALMVAALRLLPKNVARKAFGISLLAQALVILAGALKIMATMSWDDVARSLVAMAGGLVAIVAAMRLLPKNVAGKAAGILIMATSMVVLGSALKIMATMSWNDIARSLVVLAGSLVAIVAAMRLAKGAVGGAAAILIMSAALLVLAPAIKWMGKMSWGDIARSLATLAGSFIILGVAAKVLAPMTKTILKVSAALAVFGVACLLIGAGLTAVGVALTSLAGGASAIALALVTILSSIISLIPFILEQIGVGILRICDIIGGGGSSIFKAAKTLIMSIIDALVECIPALVEGLLVIVDSLLKSLADHIPSIVSSIFDIIIGIIDTIAKRAPELIQSLVNMIMSILQGTLDALKNVDPEILVKGILAIGMITALMAALATVAALTPFAMAGVIGFGLVVTELAFVLAALGKLSEIPGLTKLVGQSSGLLHAVGNGIGQFIGGLIGGLAQGVTSSLPQIATDLSAFMANIKPFIEGAAAIDPASLSGVAALTGVIMALTAADIMSGISAWIGGSSSIAEFGEEIAAFGPHLKSYANSVAGIDNSAITASAAAAQALVEMTRRIPKEGGVASWFAGENSISKFGTELVTLGTGLKSYSDSIVGFDAEAVTASAAAAQALTEMTRNIPNEGGVASWFAGENSISKFGKELVVLGESLKAYSNSVVGIDNEAIVASANAATALTEMTRNIPNEGGVAAWFAGENSISKFGTDLVVLGESLKSYSDSVAGFNTEAVIASANASSALVEMTRRIPNEGGVAAWFAGENSISKFGNDLVVLGLSLKSYSNSVAGLDADAIASSATAATALAQMADVVPNEGGVVSWFAGENSISKFGTDLVVLGLSLKSYSNSIAGFDAEAVTASANAATALAQMADMVPNEGGVVSWFAGENSISKFGNDLIALGTGLKSYSDSIVGFDGEAVTASAAAAQALAEMTSYIPNEGGVVSWFTGENSISKFGAELKTLGIGLKDFSDAVTGIDNEGVKAAAGAAQSLAEMASYIPKEGGVAAWFAGENSIAKFGTELGTLGTGIKAFSDAVTGIVPENVTAAANAAKSLAQMASYIPKEGGVAAWFAGENSISKFAGELKPLGEGLKGFSDAVTGIVPENVTAAANAAKSLAQMADTTPKNTDKIVKFGDNLVTFGGKLKTYFTKMSGLSTDAINASTNAINAVKNMSSGLDAGAVSDAADALEDLIKAIKKMDKIDSDVVDDFKSAMKDLAEVNVNSLVKAFNKASSEMTKAGKDLMSKFIEGAESQNSKLSKTGKKSIDEFVDGIEKSEDNAKKASRNIVSECATAISDKAHKFESAGKDLGNGLIKGIKAKMTAVYNAAYDLGEEAVRGEKKGQKSNSPSKLTILAGKWLGEGLIIGMNQMGRKVYDAGSDLGKTASSTVSSAISQISNAIYDDIDTQPTIRPILDLTDVRSGASALSGMLNMNSSVGVRANIGAITSMMNNRGQNGSNADIVSAIDKLNKKMDNVGNTTYQINGITYDDGSNINEAVATLVRAARIERRV